jgi:two-component system, NarL family, sensor kinase
LKPFNYILLGLYLAIFQSFQVFGSIEKADSLKLLLAQLPDSQKVYTLSDICFEYRFEEPDSALHYGNKAVLLAQKIKIPKALSQALNDRGIAHADVSNYEAALADYRQSMAIRTMLNDSLGIAALHNKIGIVYQKQGAFAKAIESQLEALRIFEALGKTAYVALAQNNVAILHSNLGNYDKSLEMHFLALETRQKLGDEFSIAMSHANIANVYFLKADTVNAIEYYEKAVPVFRNLKHSEGLSTGLHNWASSYVSSNPKKALELLNEALEIRIAMGDEKMQASTHASLGNVLLNLGQFNRAQFHLKSGLSLAKKAGVLAEQLSIYQNMARLYKGLNIADSTFFYYEKYSAIRDSAYNAGLRRDFAELQTLYESDKKEAEISLLSERNKVSDLKLQKRQSQMWLLLVFFIGLAVIATLLYFRYKEKQKARFNAQLIEEREAGLKAILTATEAERSRIAKDLHDGVGQQLSGLKMGWQKLIGDIQFPQPEIARQANALTEVLDETCDEVRSISHRMMPKSLEAFGLIPAFDDMLRKSLGPTGIAYTFEHFGLDGKRFAPNLELTLYRVSQELINNIIKHADATVVSIQLMKNSGNLILMVEDNGKGFNFEKAKRGLGIINITSRLNTISGNIDFETQSGAGTHTTVRIPIA